MRTGARSSSVSDTGASRNAGLTTAFSAGVASTCCPSCCERPVTSAVTVFVTYGTVE